MRAGHAQSLARLLNGVAGKVLGRNGAALGQLITAWTAIVGAERAARATPVRLSFPRGAKDRERGTLLLACCSTEAVYLQHAAPQLIERINVFLGYPAVGALRFVQKPAEMPTPPSARPLAPSQEKALGEAIRAVEDPALAQALDGFGRAVLGQKR